MATENKNLSSYDTMSMPSAELTAQLRIGVVKSQWNAEITDRLFQGAIQTLVECGVQKENIITTEVPGSFELTNGARFLLGHKTHAVIAIGCVIRGETSHFDYVCSSVTQGITYLNATQDTPVVFCLLTDDNIEQSRARSGGKHGNKGVEAAITAIKMATLRF